MVSDESWHELRARLALPFAPQMIELKPGATSQKEGKPTTALCMPYADPRAYQERLDDLVGIGNWEVRFQPWGDTKIICTVRIHGVDKQSTGEYDPNERERASGKGASPKGTVAEAQAFKRACVAHGLARYLYNLPTKWVQLDERKRPVDPQGVVDWMYASLRLKAWMWDPRRIRGELPLTPDEPLPARTVPLKAAPAQENDEDTLLAFFEHRGIREWEHVEHLINGGDPLKRPATKPAWRELSLLVREALNRRDEALEGDAELMAAGERAEG